MPLDITKTFLCACKISSWRMPRSIYMTVLHDTVGVLLWRHLTDDITGPNCWSELSHSFILCDVIEYISHDMLYILKSENTTEHSARAASRLDTFFRRSTWSTPFNLFLRPMVLKETCAYDSNHIIAESAVCALDFFVTIQMWDWTDQCRAIQHFSENRSHRHSDSEIVPVTGNVYWATSSLQYRTHGNRLIFSVQ